MVTGFYECVNEATFRHVPKGLPLNYYNWKKHGYAWMIEGRSCSKRPRHPVGVPPIADLLGKGVWNNQAIIPIYEEDIEYMNFNRSSEKTARYAGNTWRL